VTSQSNELPCAVVLRVGLDTDLGGVWGPITDNRAIDEKREFEFIPFPNWPTTRTIRSKPESELSRFRVNLYSYHDLVGLNHPDRKLSEFLPNDYITVKEDKKKIRWLNPGGIVPHNDPNFRYATSGEYWRSNEGGRLPVAWKNLQSGDVRANELWLLFVERLAPFTSQSGFRTMQSAQKGQNGIYLIGSMLVSEFVDIATTSWESAIASHRQNPKPIVENFHFRRRKDEPVITIGVPNKTRLWPTAIPLNFVIDGQRGVTETGRLLRVTEKDQVRFKYIYDRDILDEVLSLGP
jgi:hypothetical protein